MLVAKLIDKRLPNGKKACASLSCIAAAQRGICANRSTLCRDAKALGRACRVRPKAFKPQIPSGQGARNGRAAARLKRRAWAARAKARIEEALLQGARNTSRRRAPFLTEVVRAQAVTGASGRNVKTVRARQLLGKKVQDVRAEWGRRNQRQREREFERTELGRFVREVEATRRCAA